MSYTESETALRPVQPLLAEIAERRAENRILEQRLRRKPSDEPVARRPMPDITDVFDSVMEQHSSRNCAVSFVGCYMSRMYSF